MTGGAEQIEKSIQNPLLDCSSSGVTGWPEEMNGGLQTAILSENPLRIGLGQTEEKAHEELEWHVYEVASKGVEEGKDGLDAGIDDRHFPKQKHIWMQENDGEKSEPFVYAKQMEEAMQILYNKLKHDKEVHPTLFAIIQSRGSECHCRLLESQSIAASAALSNRTIWRKCKRLDIKESKLELIQQQPCFEATGLEDEFFGNLLTSVQSNLDESTLPISMCTLAKANLDRFTKALLYSVPSAELESAAEKTKKTNNKSNPRKGLQKRDPDMFPSARNNQSASGKTDQVGLSIGVESGKSESENMVNGGRFGKRRVFKSLWRQWSKKPITDSKKSKKCILKDAPVKK